LRDGESTLDLASAIVTGEPNGATVSTLPLASTVSLDSDRPVTIMCRVAPGGTTDIGIAGAKIVAIRVGDA
jgi:hypothetical protein